MRITAIIERNENGHYSIACDAEIGNYCLGGFGDTVEEAKADFMDVVRDAQEEYSKAHGSLPAKYKTVNVTYKYDLQTFFEQFDWINISRFARAANINESKMRQYKLGCAYPNEETRGRIKVALERMTSELCSVSL